MANEIQAADHTRVVRAIFEHAREITRNLQPTPVQVLQAALDVDAIDGPTKRVIRQTLAALPDIERAEKQLTPRMRQRLNELQRELQATRTPDQTRKVLEGARRNGNAAAAASDEETAWEEGIRTALAIIDDGKDTIYSSDFVEKTLSQQGFGTANKAAAGFFKTVGGADAAGALGGAIGAFATGAAIPLIPAAALLAGVGTSAVAAIVVAATS